MQILPQLQENYIKLHKKMSITNSHFMILNQKRSAVEEELAVFECDYRSELYFQSDDFTSDAGTSPESLSGSYFEVVLDHSSPASTASSYLSDSIQSPQASPIENKLSSLLKAAANNDDHLFLDGLRDRSGNVPTRVLKVAPPRQFRPRILHRERQWNIVAPELDAHDQIGDSDEIEEEQEENTQEYKKGGKRKFCPGILHHGSKWNFRAPELETYNQDNAIDEVEKNQKFFPPRVLHRERNRNDDVDDEDIQDTRNVDDNRTVFIGFFERQGILSEEEENLFEMEL